ncbi:MAG TPA: DUF5130 family protein [Nocardioides sp.]
MAAGELFSVDDRRQIDTTIRTAEQLSRFEFSAYVGSAVGDPRSFATQLHNTLVVPQKSLLIMVDPQQRVLEVVTGRTVRERLPDSDVLAVVAAMQAEFAAGDLVGGIVRGVSKFAELARRSLPST